MTNGCAKQTSCPDCDKMPHTELCPIHRLEMIKEQIRYWCNCAIFTSQEFKELKKKKEQEQKGTK